MMLPIHGLPRDASPHAALSLLEDAIVPLVIRLALAGGDFRRKH